MKPAVALAGLLLLAILAGCASASTSCPEVEVADCVAISNQTLGDLAIARAEEIPKLLGVFLVHPRVLPADDLNTGKRAWIVLLHEARNGNLVAAARFSEVDPSRAKLDEVVALEEAIPPLPEVIGPEIVLWHDAACRDDTSVSCLFPETEWAQRLETGNYRLFTGEVVDSLPSPGAVSS